MRVCPECETQYEDHVIECLVDGTSLEGLEIISHAPGTTGTSSMEALKSITGASPAPPPPPSKTSPILPIMLGLGLMMVMCGGLAAGLMAMQASTASPAPAPPTPAPVVAPPPPKPVVAPPPAPEPEIVKVELIELGITSTPDGASVWDGNRNLCEKTPCMISLPTETKLPMELTLRRTGRPNTDYTVKDLGVPHHVQLKRTRRAQPRPAAPAPASPKPQPSNTLRPR